MRSRSYASPAAARPPRIHRYVRRLPDVLGNAPEVLPLALSSLYTCQEVSGPLLDRVGTRDLAAGGTPTYGVTQGGRQGIAYDTNGDFHRADVHDFALASAWFAAVAFIGPSVGTESIVGRTNAGIAAGAAIYVAVPAAGQIGFIVRDDGAGSAIPVGSGDWRSKLCLLQGQIDRTAAVCRLRVSARGSTADAPAAQSIAGFTTLFEAGQVFGVGTLPGLVGGNVSVFWAAVATGSQCEGATMLPDIAYRLGFE